MLQKIKQKDAFFLVFIISVATALVVFVIVPARLAHAAIPDVAMTHGAVAASANATYSPSDVGPVAFSNSGACPRFSGAITDTTLANKPIQSSITSSKLEAGTTVTFAIALQNKSTTDDAYDVMVNYDIPAGLELPGTGAQGANLCAYNGAGVALPFAANGTGFFGSTDTDNIELTDGAGGALPAANPSGSNIAIITFDLKVSDNYTPGSTKTSTAELLGYSDTDNGTPAPGTTATTYVKTRDFEQAKTILSTSQSSTTSNFVTIGEKITYQLVVTVPEGESSAVSVIDGMSNGLALVECNSLTNDAPGDVSTDVAGGFASACNDPTNPTVANNGKDVTFDLGNIDNTDRSQSADETITIVYTAVVNNVPQAVNGISLNNAARIFWTGGDTPSGSAPVIVHEPLLTSQTVISPASGLSVGSRVRVTTTVAHTTASTAGAYHVETTTGVPAGLHIIAGTLDCQQGVVASSCNESGGTVTAHYDELLMGSEAIVTYEATVGALSGNTVNANATTVWGGTPVPITTAQSPYSATTVGRTSDTTSPGGASNSYQQTSTGSATLATATPNPSDSGAGNDQQGGSLPNTGMNWIVVLLVAGLGMIASGLLIRRLVKR